MAKHLRARDHLAQALQAVEQERWREAARQLYKAEKAWPEPPDFLAQTWRRWRIGGLLGRLAQERANILSRAIDACEEEAQPRLAQLATDPHASESAAALASVVRDLGCCGEAARGEAIRQRVAEWSRAAKTYQSAVQLGELALRGLRFRDATAAYSAAVEAFATPEALQGQQASQAGLAQEAQFDQQLAQAQQALQQGHPLTARAWATCAHHTLARPESRDLLSQAKRHEMARGHLLDALRAGQAGAWARAERAFGAAEALVPADTRWAGQLRQRQAAMAMRRGLPERAVEHLQGVSGAEGAYGLALAQLGRYLEAGEYLTAAGEFEQAACVRAHAARRSWQTFQAMTECVARRAWDDAEQVALAHLTIEPDAAVQAALDETIQPGRSRQGWDQATPSERVALSLAALQYAPGPMPLHNWFVALDEARGGDTAHMADWLVATAAVVANLGQSPAFEGPHRAWLPADREAIRCQLRERVEQLLDAARETAPNSEQVWRDVWRVEVGALGLADTGQRWPQLAGLNLTPGLWHKLGTPSEAKLPEWGHTPEQRAFATLYSSWAEPIGAWLARDAARVTCFKELPTAGIGPEGGRPFAQAVVEVESALASLEAGDMRALGAVQPHRELILAHSPWREAVDRLAEQLARQREEEFDSDSFSQMVLAWRALTGAPAATDWCVRHAVSNLARRLDADQISESEGLRQAEDLLKEYPGHALAVDLKRRISDSLIAERIEAAMRRNDFAGAVSMAVREGSPSLRARIADVFLSILQDNMRGMNPYQLRQWVGWLCELQPDNPIYRELQRKVR
ncbi:MAG: hypothetical protein VKP62_02975 [Candidatus Sericytochromatia bacterium]|nr:hypothetical protein [Candidatus Sericytochromatia bacterium]